MCDELSSLLKPAIEETEEDLEREKLAQQTFVDSDPDDYDNEEEYEDEYDEYEDWCCIDTQEYHMLENVQKYIREEMLPLFSRTDVLMREEDMHIIMGTLNSVKDWAHGAACHSCDYHIR